MKMEKPIITTDMGFAHTICENAALYFEPLNPEDATKKISHLVDHPELQKELVTNGKEVMKNFNTAEERAKKYLDICLNLIANSQPPNANS